MARKRPTTRLLKLFRQAWYDLGWDYPLVSRPRIRASDAIVRGVRYEIHRDVARASDEALDAVGAAYLAVLVAAHEELGDDEDP